jgi:hypothetical protein
MFDKAQVTSRPGETPRWNRIMLVGYNSWKVHTEAFLKLLEAYAQRSRRSKKKKKKKKNVVINMNRRGKR